MKSSFYNLAGGVVRIGISLITVPLLVRKLGLEEYGLWELVSATVGLIAVMEAGLPVATTAFLSRDLGANDKAALTQTFWTTTLLLLLVSTLAAISVWFGAEQILRIFPKIPPDRADAALAALKMSAPIIWMRLMQQNFAAVQQAFQHYGRLNVLMTVQSIAANAGSVVVAAYGGRLVELMQWQLIISAAGILVQGFAAGKLLTSMHSQFKWNFARVKEIWRFSALSWTTSLGTILFTQCDRLIIGSLLGLSAVGIYAAVIKIVGQINVLSALPIQPLLPMVSRSHGANSLQSAHILEQIRKSTQFSALVALGLGGGLLLQAPTVMSIFLAQVPLEESVGVFRIAVIVYTLYSLNAAGFFILQGLGAMKICSLIGVGFSLLSLGLIAIGSLKLQLAGAIAGNAGYLGTLILTSIAMKKLKLRLSEWTHWFYFPITCFAGAAGLDAYMSFEFAPRTAALLIFATILCYWFTQTQRGTVTSFTKPQDG